MHPDLAVQTSAPHWALTCLAGLRGCMAAVPPHPSGAAVDDLTRRLDDILAGFVVDYDRVADIADLLFLPDITAYGARTTAVFERWDADPAGCPSLPAFWAHASDRFGLVPDSPLMRIAMMASLLAEIPNTLLYHGNDHYRKVMFHTIRLIATHRAAAFDGFPVLDDDDIYKIMIAATIHDLGHEGGDNLRDDIYTPGYMEQKALDLMRPYFDDLGMDRDFRADIEALVFCTDITFFAGDNSPCVRMKKIYRHFFIHDLAVDEDIESMMIGKLRRFEDNPKLALLAMLLHEADVATSAGLSYEQSRLETISIMEERGLKIAGPKVLLKFMIEQMGGQLYTPAAKIIFSDIMEKIMQQASADLQSGVQSYYE